jgi:hypothetical protein
MIFGVRHFSPAAGIHVRRALDDAKPEVVLIEGPSDATDLLKHLADRRTVPPVALLAFTKERPVRSLVYPFSSYCAEWVALRWAMETKREVRFIDLPAGVFLARRREQETANAKEEKPPKDDSQAYLDDPYEEIARLAGEQDHHTWWERQFEHAPDVASYRDAILEFGRGLREVRQGDPMEAENLLRESFMRREIARAVKDPSKAAIICGAFHAPALEGPVMTDEEAGKLPRVEVVLTLMPYSYPRLSSQSGYGAGNHAPAYFEKLHEETARGTPGRLRSRYFAEIARSLRQGGIVRSSAEVIEAVRLAEGLATLNGSHAPALRDLRDAAVTLLGQGERAPLEKAISEVEIGSSIGRLPPGVTRTALQDDFHHFLESLKLDKYLADKDQTLELDLREDRHAKTKEAAFLDRRRSTFLHRLNVLEVGFGSTLARNQQGTAKEKWNLRWKPECEMALAERSLLADSIETGAALALSNRLAEAKDVGEAAAILLRAAECELADALSKALVRVQELTVDEAGFGPASVGIANLVELVRYGSVRDVDPAPLRPILSQLYLRATLLAFGSCVCDDDAAKLARHAMDRVQDAAFLGEPDLPPDRWVDALRQISASDDRNAFLSGYATALLIERGRMTDEEIDREVSKRLSPGTEPSVGVGWFEGLVQRNRAALFLRPSLWASLHNYVDPLTDEEFKASVLYLRRAFSSFAQGEIRRVVGLLGELWKGGGAELAGEVEKKLDEKEIKEAAGDLEGLDLV